MEEFIIFFLMYFLSFFGFLLGKATKEEYLELSKIVPIINEVFLLFTYILFGYFFTSFFQLFFLFVSFLIFVVGKFISEFLDLHNVLFYSLTFYLALYVTPELMGLVIFPTIYLFLINSFKKFNLKEKIYEVIFITIIFLVVYNFLSIFL